MKRFITYFVISMLIVENFLPGSAFAQQQLLYSNNSEQNPAPNVQTGYSQAVPVNYSTAYDNQYSSYASFMQSPYGQMPAAGMGAGGVPYAYGTNPGINMGSNGQDPLGASEVSPYSHYSPYTEIVGEGSTYTLGIDDVVTIIVRGQPDFSGRFIVDPEGNIQFPFVGDIPAVGKTKEELKNDVLERLKKFVRYPESSIMVSEYRSKAVYVLGLVGRPGKYAMKGDRITVKEAIVAAGLGRSDAALSRVYVIRPSENTESGKAEKTKVNVDQMLHKGDSAENFFLEPGDTIIVSQRYYDKFVNGFSRLVGPLFQAAAVYNLAYGQSSGFLVDDEDN